jgi:hypothetical protein
MKRLSRRSRPSDLQAAACIDVTNRIERPSDCSRWTQGDEIG